MCSFVYTAEKHFINLIKINLKSPQRVFIKSNILNAISFDALNPIGQACKSVAITREIITMIMYNNGITIIKPTR